MDKSRSLLILITLVAAALCFIFPESLFSPGPLHRVHQTSADCSSCHTPFSDPGKEGCVAAKCHDAASWAKEQALFSGHTKGEGCDECHTEHSGANASLTPVLAHDASITARSNCLECHQLTARHRKVKEKKCQKCHSLMGWRPVVDFDHSLVDQKKLCNDCHKLSQKHFDTKKSCDKCHTKKRWSPSRLRHRFPVQHRSRKGTRRCDTCHPVSYSTYTCYNKGCHKHRDNKMERRHKRKRIADYDRNCVKCHPTGREREGIYRKSRRRR